MDWEDWDNKITELMKKWKNLTQGKKPIQVALISNWQWDMSPHYTVYVYFCNNSESYYSSDKFEVQEWLFQKITSMIEKESTSQ